MFHHDCSGLSQQRIPIGTSYKIIICHTKITAASNYVEDSILSVFWTLFHLVSIMRIIILIKWQV